MKYAARPPTDLLRPRHSGDASRRRPRRSPRRSRRSSDPTRVAIVNRLAAAPEVCVCDLTAAFELSQPTISHHLRILRDAGLVEAERRGTWAYYRLVPEAIDCGCARRSPASRAARASTRAARGTIAVVRPASALLALDEARLEQHLEVVADGRLRRVRAARSGGRRTPRRRAATGSGSAAAAGPGRRSP